MTFDEWEYRKAPQLVNGGESATHRLLRRWDGNPPRCKLRCQREGSVIIRLLTP